jgi:H+/Cl- antiporter ClcA
VFLRLRGQYRYGRSIVSEVSQQQVKSMIRDRDFRRLLILSAVVGLVVSLAAWAFLTIVPFVQDLIYMDLPGVLGFSETPWGWPLPVLAIAGALTALALL